MTTTRRTRTRHRIAAALVALAALGGAAATTAQPAEAASYRTAVGGPWGSMAYCQQYVAMASQTHPGAFGLCASTTYQGRSGIWSIMQFPVKNNLG